MLISFVDVLIPKELNPIGLICKLFVNKFLDNLTAVEVPIPTERLGLTFMIIKSSLINPW